MDLIKLKKKEEKKLEEKGVKISPRNFGYITSHAREIKENYTRKQKMLENRLVVDQMNLGKIFKEIGLFEELDKFVKKLFGMNEKKQRIMMRYDLKMKQLKEMEENTQQVDLDMPELMRKHLN